MSFPDDLAQAFARREELQRRLARYQTQESGPEARVAELEAHANDVKALRSALTVFVGIGVAVRMQGGHHHDVTSWIAWLAALLPLFGCIMVAFAMRRQLRAVRSHRLALDAMERARLQPSGMPLDQVRIARDDHVHDGEEEGAADEAAPHEQAARR